jgi:alpha-ketoglutarate-dependent taurine dioxygenase
MVTPSCGTDDWLGTVRSHHAWIVERLKEHGALLFRGFGVADARSLNAFCQAAGFELHHYRRGITPRHVVEGGVYTATDAPHAVPIPLHNEMSYTSVYPGAIALCCEKPPSHQGQTPIADMAGVLGRLGDELVDRFESHGICYRERVPPEASRPRGKSWQEMFDTHDPQQAEAACSEQGIDFRWEDDALHIESIRPAVLPHPVSGRRVWFNQAHIFHHSFSAELFHHRKWLLGLVLRLEESIDRFLPAGSFGYSRECTYGDGSPIERATIDRIRRAIWRETVVFEWQRGDLLLLDNLRIAHGREPFRADRRILAALIAGIHS